jgi:hypothetical protein
VKSNADRVREWRAKHREVNRERQRGYQAWQRAKAKAASLNAPGPAAPEVKAEVKPAPVVEVEPIPVPARPADVPEVQDVPLVAGRPLKVNPAMARFLAKTTTAGPAPAALPDDAEPAPAMPAMSQRQWARLDPDARVRWVRLNLPNVTDDDKLAEWLATLPK